MHKHNHIPQEVQEFLKTPGGRAAARKIRRCLWKKEHLCKVLVEALNSSAAAKNGIVPQEQLAAKAEGLAEREAKGGWRVFLNLVLMETVEVKGKGRAEKRLARLLMSLEPPQSMLISDATSEKVAAPPELLKIPKNCSNGNFAEELKKQGQKLAELENNLKNFKEKLKHDNKVYYLGLSEDIFR